MTPGADHRHAEHMRHNDSKEADRQGRIEISRRPAQQRHKNLAVLAVFDKANRAHARQKAEPIVNQDKQKKRQNDGQKPFRLFAAARNRIGKPQGLLQKDFKNVLQSLWHGAYFFADKYKKSHKDKDRGPAHDERIGNSKAAEVRDRLGKKSGLVGNLFGVLLCG